MHRAHQRALRTLQTEVLCKSLANFLYGDTQLTVRDLAVLLDLVLHLHGDVDWNREGKTLEATGTAEDLRIHADHLAAQIEQRASRVAGIDRSIGLYKAHVGILRQRTCLGAYDARRRGRL